MKNYVRYLLRYIIIHFYGLILNRVLFEKFEIEGDEGLVWHGDGYVMHRNKKLRFGISTLAPPPREAKNYVGNGPL